MCICASEFVILCKFAPQKTERQETRHHYGGGVLIWAFQGGSPAPVMLTEQMSEVLQYIQDYRMALIDPMSIAVGD